MVRTVLTLALAATFLGCAQERISILDAELEVYRYEQEKYRRKDLKQQYEEELACCEELTEKILGVRAEIAEKEGELRELRQRLLEIEAELAEAKRKAAAAERQKQPAMPAPVKKPETTTDGDKPPAGGGADKR